MRVEVTSHAVEQFHKRYCADEPRAAADAALRILAVSACATKAKTLKGDPIWQADGVRLVMRHDTALRAHVVVTVLPPEDEPPADDHFEPEPRPAIAEPSRRVVEFDLAKAERELERHRKDVEEATNRFARAQAHLVETKAAEAEARGRLEKLKESVRA